MRGDTGPNSRAVSTRLALLLFVFDEMITPRKYQSDAVRALFDYFKIRRGNPLLVIPTGGGKSVVQAVFVKKVLEQWPDQRILLLTHVKELIEQNFMNLHRACPGIDAGIYSASLNRRDIGHSVTLAGIQSVYSKAWDLGRYDLIIIDEAHLIPPRGEGMYRTFFDDSRRINPKIKIIGLTATPYRLKQGLLHQGDNRLFTEIAFNLPIRDLLDEGHLSPLTTEPVQTRADVSGVGNRGGEFIQSQLEKAVDIDSLTRAAVIEMTMLARTRSRWLIFCASVDHALHVRDALRAAGITTETVTGKSSRADRDGILSRFKSGAIRAVTNVNVLTTGFDAPGIDMIAYLRPTQSPGLYLQMAGRGMRIAPGKRDCLVLDFAGNIERHGPVDRIRPPKGPSGRRVSAVAVLKQCPECEAFVYAGSARCRDCDHEFPAESLEKHFENASTAPILSHATDYLKTIDITRTEYRKHQKKGKPPSMRVDYYQGMRRIASEWICLEHDGYSACKARTWIYPRLRPGVECPRSVDAAIDCGQRNELKTPKSIILDTRGKYERIVGYKFDDPAGKETNDRADGTLDANDPRHADRDAVRQMRASQ